MTSRERVLAAVNHEQPDRIPVDFGGTFATSFTAGAYNAVRAELGLSIAPSRIVSSHMMLVETEFELRQALGLDTIGLYFGGGHVFGWQPWTTPDGARVELSRDLEVRPRADGGWDLFSRTQHVGVMPAGGLYFDPADYPKWRDYDPGELTDDVLRDLETRARMCHESTDLAVILNVPYTVFNGTSPDFLCALVLEKEEVHERLELWTDHVIECLKLLLEAVRDTVSIIAFSGDAGAQRGPLVSPGLYREMILPHFRRIPDHLHSHSDIKFFYHTCGSVYRLMECFVELGVDIINPLQVGAEEMEAERLAAEFGNRLVFWGGGIDAQQTLVNGNEQEVRDKVRLQLSHYAATPGYVFALDHNVQPDVPPRSFLAMLDEVRRRG